MALESATYRISPAFRLIDQELVTRLQEAIEGREHDTFTHALLVLNRALCGKDELLASQTEEIGILQGDVARMRAERARRG